MSPEPLGPVGQIMAVLAEAENLARELKEIATDHQTVGRAIALEVEAEQASLLLDRLGVADLSRFEEKMA